MQQSAQRGQRPRTSGSRSPRGNQGSKQGNRFNNRGEKSVRRRHSLNVGRPKRKKGHGVYINPARFINKAAAIEEVAYVPTHRFVDFALLPEVKDAIVKRGYELPTAIQDESIPHTLEGRDIVGLADTGSGKTGAFLIPLINKMVMHPTEHVLIVVPTRELAIQIEDELRALTKSLKLDSVCCVGGVGIGPQLRGLSRRPHFVIGTPGRLKDVIERRALDLSRFETIVLDEADRMLDMGFVADMRYLMALMPKERQVCLFSATLSPEIEKLIGSFLNDPVRISVKTRDTSKNVEQDIVRIPHGGSKYEVLSLLLAQPEMQKVLVFGRTKHGAEKLAKQLEKSGFKADSIHGNKSHVQRQRSLKRFSGNEVQILVATDVAARGLDIPGVSHVINYDLPNTHDDYVHRIGRTGRGTARGVALTFIEE